MRFLELNLPAWGPFTDESIDFKQGTDGVHIVYGLNEAGKTSCLRALYAMFFGMHERTTDNFKHDNRDLRIGAKIENEAGKKLTFLRRKGRKNTIIKPDGTEYPEDILKEYLPPTVNEELFRNMFALDHIILREGGMQLAQGGGNLGEILFAAGSGTGDMKQLLEDLESEADSLFKKRASSSTIFRLTTDYNRLTEEARNLSIPGSKWEKQKRRCQSLEKKREKLNKEIRELGTERERLNRLKDALPIISRRQSLIEELAEYEGLPSLRADFGEERRVAQEQLKRAEGDLETAEEALGKLKEQIDSLTIREGLLRKSEEIEALYQKAGSHRKALEDRPKLEADRERALKRCQDILCEIGRDISIEKAKSERIPIQVRTRVTKLIGEYGECNQIKKDAESRIAEIESEYESLNEELANLPDERSTDTLLPRIKETRKEGNLNKKIIEGEKKLSKIRKQAESALKSLPYWEGELSKVDELPVPSSETIGIYNTELSGVEEEIRAVERQLKEQEEEIEESEGRLKKLKGKSDIPSEDSLKEARKERDKNWGILKKVLQKRGKGSSVDLKGGTVEGYEEAVAKADEISDRLRLDSERVAELNQTLSNLERQKTALKRKTKYRSELLGKKEKLEKNWKSEWKETGIDARSPGEMEAWKRKQQNLVQLVSAIRDTEAEIDDANEKVTSYSDGIRDALSGIGERPPKSVSSLEALIECADEIIEEIRETEKERGRLEKAKKQKAIALKKQEQTTSKAKEDLKKWQDQWKQAVKKIGLNKSALPEEANSVLEKMQELRDELNKEDDGSARINAIDKEYEVFTDEVKTILDEIDMELSCDEAIEIIGELNRELGKAQKNKATLEQLQERKEKQEKGKGKARREIKEADEKINGLLEEASCAGIDDLPDLEQRVEEVREKREDLSDSEKELSGYCAGKTIEQLVEETLEMDADALSPRIDELNDKISGLEKEREEVADNLGGEREILRQMDGRGEAAEKKESAEQVASQIMYYSEKYSKLKMASVLLRSEIERFREENQEPIVKKAGGIFASLTSGSFAALQTDYDKNDTPILLGIRDAGDRLRVDEMSDGTRDQLFLALRLAFIEKAIESSEPLPLILDDVLINFDDDRSAEAFKVLGKLSNKTQVILFTHHQHLIELAKGVLDKDALFIQDITP